MPLPDGSHTAEDHASFPQEWGVQVIDGELLVIPAPDWRHQAVVRELLLQLCRHLGPEGSKRAFPAPFDVHLDDRSVLQPDLVVLPSPPGTSVPLPVWVAEVLSSSTRAHDVGPKRTLYARHGVRELWLLDPEDETVELCDLVRGTSRVFRGGEPAVSDALAGFAADPEGLFRVR